jgi:hypothetical protein
MLCSPLHYFLPPPKNRSAQPTTLPTPETRFSSRLESPASSCLLEGWGERWRGSDSTNGGGGAEDLGGGGGALPSFGVGVGVAASGEGDLGPASGTVGRGPK